jgi:hypothetical protein
VDVGVGGIDHRDAVVLLQRRIMVRSIVSAVSGVRRSILRICSLTSVLAHEFQIAVVGPFGIAAEAFLRRRLALKSAFRMISKTTMGFGYRSQEGDAGLTLGRFSRIQSARGQRQRDYKRRGDEARQQSPAQGSCCVR